MRRPRRALLGAAFLGVLALLLGLSVAQYAGAFDSGVPVTLRVERVGTQLAQRADVKVRGLVVGHVEQIGTDGDGATVRMSLDPALVDQIPANVSARLLPKTLFGEKYVALVPPATPSTARLAAGDTIGLDRSQAAMEVERVLDDLLPLLEAVKPQQLAMTLSAVSQGLAGRGEQLGETLVRFGTLVKGLRPAVPDLQADVSELAEFTNDLADSAPDLLNALADLTTTSRTLVDQRDDLHATTGTVGGTADDLRAFLDANGDNLIRLAASARPTLETLARYAPEFPCFFQQINGLIPLIDDQFGKSRGEPGVHITLEIVDNRGKYVPHQDEPRYADDRGPRCYPITDPGPQYPPDGPFRDGSVPPAAAVGQPVGPPSAFGTDDYGTWNGTTSWGTVRGGAPGRTASAPSGATPASWHGADMGLPNSAGEQQMVAELVAVQDGGSPRDVPGWGSVLVGPLYRGTEVSFT